MWAAFSDVLEHHPNVRQVMPTLALVERALAAGPRALRRLPAPCVRDASARLDVLAGDWGSDDLRRLRRLLQRLGEAPAVTVKASAWPDLGEVEVTETSLDRFLEAGQELDRQVEGLERQGKSATMRMRTLPGP